MNRVTGRTVLTWALPAVLALLMTGCASDRSRCYAKALPTQGEGGLAWGPNAKAAEGKAVRDCATYAGRSGGTPGTCRVVLVKCK